MKMLKKSLCAIPLATVFLLGSCNEKPHTLFELVSPGQSQVHFSNQIIENDTLNILKEEYIYNGGGVGIGDFNNDGLPDIFFSGNMVDNALYLNKSQEGEDLQFEEITQTAKVSGKNQWCSGVALVDINEDGWLDIYVSSTLKKNPDSRANLLYINNGLNEEGVPVFTESAAAYGIADKGNTTQAAFFDYDNDGDLDLYLLTNVIDTKVPVNYREKIRDGSATNNDRLYRNDGQGANGHSTFTNVSQEAGITIEGFGLGITISDINLDGWADIYITNDYLTNDLLYINNQDGTFTNKVGDYLRHQSYSAMGNDVVDFNNDGLVDIVALDMLPESNSRKKQMLGPNNYVTYLNNERYDYQYQYVRNTLQLNNGFTPDGNPSFSEIGQLSGVYQTDWSWTPLVADFDNDGFRDMIVTNGFPKDVTDRDFASYRSGVAGGVASVQTLQEAIPVVKISNYAYQNKGSESDGVLFADKTEEWGLSRPSFSNGAAYADLDNDGDLDVVVNNINDSAFIYRNTLMDREQEAAGNASNHFLKIKIAGQKLNQQGIGTTILINYGEGKIQHYENAIYRGYLSSMNNIAHFGLGEITEVDSISVRWPDGKTQLLTNIQVDQQITVKYEDAKGTPPAKINAELQLASVDKPFKKINKDLGISYVHHEEDRIDFNVQRTLPQKYTQGGPGIAVGDVNQDGLDDFYVGGAAGNNGTLYLQNNQGKFMENTQKIGQMSKEGEEMGVLFFDADNDGDLDLYTAMGSYEFQNNPELLQDHLYLNDGKGNIQLAPADALPKMTVSSSCVKAADYDQDGDLDLFVGGYVSPGQYPKPVSSFILRNDNGRFTDVTQEVCPELINYGMVTDALWTDFDNDGKADLLLAAEWQPLTFLKNTGEALESITSQTGIGESVGWWSSLAAGDFDNDGDIDYVAGNLGTNTSYKASPEYPMSVYANDFDENGAYDAFIICYIKDDNGEMKPYPVHARDDMISQMIRIRRDFPKYEKYGQATIDSVFSEEQLKDAVIYHANHMESSFIENLGGGQFKISSLPWEAQLAPLYGMVAQDIDRDGNLDLLAVGNNYGAEVFTGRYDALNGLYLKGNGKGQFEAVNLNQSGWYVPGDAKGLTVAIGAQEEPVYLATQNKDSLIAYTSKQMDDFHLITLEPKDAWAEVKMPGDKVQKVEFYYGSTYLSQSTRHMYVSKKASGVTIYDFQGNSRQPQVLSGK